MSSHRYLGKVDCSSYNSSPKLAPNVSVRSGHKLLSQNKADGPTRQAGSQGSVPAITAKIFAEASLRSNIHKKTGSERH